jgi:Protein of unknown function (DUF2637)
MKWNLGRQPRRTPVTIPLGRVELIAITVLVLLALVAVISVAIAISYSHMFDWALINGEPRWRAHLSPISVDGVMFAASLVMYADARMRNRPDRLAYLTLFAGVGWSVLANMNHNWVDPLAAKTIAAWPPLALFVSVELVLRFVRRLRERSEVQSQKTEKAVQPRAEKAVAEPRPIPAPKPVPSEPISLDGLTEEMRKAGWAPSDYDNLGAAMYGYLEKVSPEASGSDLWAIVGPFFGKSGKDTGMGRTIARKFKEEQAAKSAAGE